MSEPKNTLEDLSKLQEKDNGLVSRLGNLYWKSFGYVGGVVMPYLLTVYLAGEAAFRYEGAVKPDTFGNKAISCATCHFAEKEERGYVPREWFKDFRAHLKGE